jgi:parallel beta-helix repeat protein
MTSTTPKDWRNATAHDGGGDTSTPLSAVALEDLETRVMPPWFNVSHYGATGLGADYTTQIQEAVDACGAAGGGIVFIPAGSYLTTGITVSNANVSICGTGVTSSLELTSGAAQSDILSVTGDNCAVRDLQLDGSANTTAATTGALYAEGADYLIVERVYVNNPQYRGIQVRNSSYIGIRACTVIDSVESHAIAIESTSSAGDIRYADITGNHINRLGITPSAEYGHGISAHTVSGTSQLRFLNIVDNSIEMNENEWGNGIEIWGFTVGSNGPHNYTIANNNIRGSLFGISCASSKWCSITGNTIRRAYGYGIEIASSSSCACDGNTVDGNGVSTHGIRVNDQATPSNVTITGNVVTDVTDEGISVAGGNNCVISGNTISMTGAGASGIVATEGSGVGVGDDIAIVGNSVHGGNSLGNAIQVVNFPNFTITGNHLDDYDNSAGFGVTLFGNEAVTFNGIISGNLFSGEGTGNPVGTNLSGGAALGDVRIESNSGFSVPTTASAAAVTLPIHSPVHVISGTANITSITAAPNGRIVTLRFNNTAGAAGVVDGSNLKISANLPYTPDDTLTLLSNGSNWYEVARSVN